MQLKNYQCTNKYPLPRDKNIFITKIYCYRKQNNNYIAIIPPAPNGKNHAFPLRNDFYFVLRNFKPSTNKNCQFPPRTQFDSKHSSPTISFPKKSQNSTYGIWKIQICAISRPFLRNDAYILFVLFIGCFFFWFFSKGGFGFWEFSKRFFGYICFNITVHCFCPCLGHSCYSTDGFVRVGEAKRDVNVCGLHFWEFRDGILGKLGRESLEGKCEEGFGCFLGVSWCFLGVFLVCCGCGTYCFGCFGRSIVLSPSGDSGRPAGSTWTVPDLFRFPAYPLRGNLSLQSCLYYVLYPRMYMLAVCL